MKYIIPIVWSIAAQHHRLATLQGTIRPPVISHKNILPVTLEKTRRRNIGNEWGFPGPCECKLDLFPSLELTRPNPEWRDSVLSKAPNLQYIFEHASTSIIFYYHRTKLGMNNWRQSEKAWWHRALSSRLQLSRWTRQICLRTFGLTLHKDVGRISLFEGHMHPGPGNLILVPKIRVWKSYFL